jgi:hypothetical protein
VHQFELVWDRYELAALSIHQALGQWILEKSSGGLYEYVTSLEVAVIAYESNVSESHSWKQKLEGLQ